MTQWAYGINWKYTHSRSLYDTGTGEHIMSCGKRFRTQGFPTEANNLRMRCPECQRVVTMQDLAE